MDSKLLIKMEFCKRLSKCLDLLGYNQEMIDFRREKNTQLDDIHNITYPIPVITSGGKAEGTALYFESDIDRLFILKGMTCVNPSLSCSSHTVFHIDRLNCSPGYARLKIVQANSSLEQNQLKLENGYVMNDFSIGNPNTTDPMFDVNGTIITKQDRIGPAERYGNDFINYDFVVGMVCICPDLIEKWIQRERKYDWPDHNLVHQISSLEGHIVAVSDKGSMYPLTEWRICYTKAEIMLVYSFTESQAKLYMLLKLMAKSVLKPLCPAMSSYIMKNIVFWEIETNPSQHFSHASLIDRLIDTIIFLKKALESDYLESYMISERNLFQGRITDMERTILLEKVDELLKERENMFKHCTKIHRAMLKLKESPGEYSQEADKRDHIEKLVLNKNVIIKQTETADNSKEPPIQDRLKQNEKFIHYEKELHRLVVPDESELLKSDHNLEEVYRHRLFDILS
ncbi:uncharacterized protein LOC127704565 [Mytilus californianus]|uniref:uncharacterized protein LOC127704565 n=1 Tax=Mytilus californianus TaxID=6549 RepID=UPI002246C795|nr:uncharacterized protein LOC127704565 [Mytilus californianus]XP_052064645.1 uncharacterized protein LOC127704565 [Mytilus californianus]XP_052064646.1 uncharacterized protein LOC127704565 [Mytilus californianus]